MYEKINKLQFELILTLLQMVFAIGEYKTNTTVRFSRKLIKQKH